jgi:hypothetical protein
VQSAIAARVCTSAVCTPTIDIAQVIATENPLQNLMNPSSLHLSSDSSHSSDSSDSELSRPDYERFNYTTSTDNETTTEQMSCAGESPVSIPISVATNAWLEEFRKNGTRIAFDWAEQRESNWRCQCQTAFSTRKACLKHMSYFVRKNKPHVHLFQSDPEPNEEPRLEFSMSRSKNLAWLTYFKETCSAHFDQIVSEEGISERRQVRRRRRSLVRERAKAKCEKEMQKERREKRKGNRAHTDQMSSEEEEKARMLPRSRIFFDSMEAMKMKREEKEKREENGGNPMPEYPQSSPEFC